MTRINLQSLLLQSFVKFNILFIIALTNFIMKQKTICKLIILIGIMFGSYSANAQNRVPQQGPNRGQDQNRNQESFSNVDVIEVFSRNGEKVYSYGTRETAKNPDGRAKISKVVKNNKGLKIYFNGEGRVVEILCRECIVKLEYKPRSTSAR